MDNKPVYYKHSKHEDQVCQLLVMVDNIMGMVSKELEMVRRREDWKDHSKVLSYHMVHKVHMVRKDHKKAVGS